jgi:phosphoglycolate phosphatase-like HAD superfamily hydrolase
MQTNATHRDLQGLILDFDGVVLESEEMKIAAWVRLFAHEPRHLDAIRRYMGEYAGLPRGVKLRHVFLAILKRPLSRQEEEAWAQRFDGSIAEEYRRCPPVNGAQELLETYSSRCPLFIVSGTPQDSLREIVEVHGLTRYFTAVFGSPPTKGTLCAQILRQWKLDPRRVVVVGDSRPDLDGAREAGIPFIGRVRSGGETFQGLGVPTVRDLRELKAVLDTGAIPPPPTPSAKVSF